MNEPTTLGAYLRRERETRGLTLRTISESTKVSHALLEGLEADDISRWPGGIFRRAFVRSYAQCVGLDPEDVIRRFEQQHVVDIELPPPGAPLEQARARTSWVPSSPYAAIAMGGSSPVVSSPAPQRARVLGTIADLTVAIVLAFGSAAAGSRLLWPVLLIASYYAVGILLTGTSPMVALLNEPEPAPARPPAVPATPVPQAVEPPPPSPAERRSQPRRTSERPRQRRGAQARA
jgi:Helix-turn-helix domain